MPHCQWEEEESGWQQIVSAYPPNRLPVRVCVCVCVECVCGSCSPLSPDAGCARPPLPLTLLLLLPLLCSSLIPSSAPGRSDIDNVQYWILEGWVDYPQTMAGAHTILAPRTHTLSLHAWHRQSVHWLWLQAALTRPRQTSTRAPLTTTTAVCRPRPL